MRVTAYIMLFLGLLGGCNDQDPANDAGLPTCRVDSECPDGQHCNDDGVCDYECLEDSDCGGAGQRCDERGRCVPSGDTDGDADLDLDSDAVHDASEDADLPGDADVERDADADGSEEEALGPGAEFLPDEGAVGGGPGDSWRPAGTVELSCPWLAQVPPGNWTDTMNCGPVSVEMAAACLEGWTPTADDTSALLDWMNENIVGFSSDAPDYNGSLTNTEQLANAASGYFDLEASRRTHASLEDLYGELAAGRPVIVASETQTTNDAPGREMVFRCTPNALSETLLFHARCHQSADLSPTA